jgi:hypothetical protein
MTLRPVESVKGVYLPMRITQISLAVKWNEPFGPRVTLTAFARMSTPRSIACRPSWENLISLCAPRAVSCLEGCCAARARRIADDAVRFPTLCILRCFWGNSKLHRDLLVLETVGLEERKTDLRGILLLLEKSWSLSKKFVEEV